MKKYFKRILFVTVSILAACILLFVYQNSYEMDEKKIEIQTPSKPGIDGSEGNWLEQSMEDRAQEVIHAINWAKTLPMIDSERIGLWGASQGGWVIPKVVKEDRNIAFSILVSPAINWISQGKYNTKKSLEKEGYSEKEIEQVEKYDNKVLDLLNSQSSYDDYLNIANKDHLISRDRWNFIGLNYLSDATEDLKYFNSPIYLVLGGRDINVDVDNIKLMMSRQNTGQYDITQHIFYNVPQLI